MKRREFVKSVGAAGLIPFVGLGKKEEGLLEKNFKSKSIKDLKHFINYVFCQSERHDVLVIKVFVSRQDFVYLTEKSGLGQDILDLPSERDCTLTGDGVFLWTGRVYAHDDNNMKTYGEFAGGTYEITIDETYISSYMKDEKHPHFTGKFNLKEGYGYGADHKLTNKPFPMAPWHDFIKEI